MKNSKSELIINIAQKFLEVSVFSYVLNTNRLQESS